ncbi:MAG: FAD-binding oxidoreductase, partial [Rubrivivax sp.]
MTGLHFHSLTVQALQHETDDAVVVGFAVPPALRDSFAFEPGQYLTLKHGELRRSYSICAAPGEGLRVGIRHVPGGAFSGWVHGALQPGDTLEVLPPQGRFGAALAKQPRHVLLVAGGSGITPVLSLLKTQLGRDANTRCTLLYGNRSAASTMFKEEIEDLKNRHLTRLAVHPVFSREQVDLPLQAGRIDAQKIGQVLRLAGAVDQAFVCGPHAMNDEVEAALLASGLAPQQVHVERFGVPPSAAETALHAP